VAHQFKDAVSLPFFPFTSHKHTNPRATRFIETHSKTFTNGIAIFCSVGGWFLWNVILSCTYNRWSTIYYVRATFLQGFGASVTWWACLITILLGVLVFELATKALLAAFFPTDEDTFQALEKDPAVKRRLEEAAADELQAGWDRGAAQESSGGGVSPLLPRAQRRLSEEERREEVVKQMLRNRVEVVDPESSPERSGPDEVDRILSQGYGRVR
jgi:phospholipid-translocating ATPase